MLKEFMLCPTNIDLKVVPPSVEFKDELKLNESEKVYVHDVFHCDGLLLCTTIDNRLVVWNPCLGETRWIHHKYGNGRYVLYVFSRIRKHQIWPQLQNHEVLVETLRKSKPVVEIYDFCSDTWRVLDDVTLEHYENTYWTTSYTTNGFLFRFDFTKERVKRMSLPRSYGWNVLSVVGEEKLAVLHQSKLTLSMDVWVTNKIDTVAALTWSKSFTLDDRRVALPRSFVLDEEKKMALCSSDSREFMVYTVGKDDGCYPSIPCKEESKYKLWWSFILNYVPSLVQPQQ